MTTRAPAREAWNSETPAGATRGRPVETVQAELQAARTWTNASSDPALQARIDLIQLEHAEALRARRRENEEDLLTGASLEVGRES